MGRKHVIGLSLASLSLTLCLVGLIGFTFEGSVTDIPTPNTPDRTYFSDEPLPQNSLAPFVVANVKFTWDRDDIYVVIVDADEKADCESTPEGLGGFGSSTACSSSDPDIVAGGADSNGDDGIEWQIESGEYYVGMGNIFSNIPEGTQVSIDYQVHLKGSFVMYFVCIILGFAGLAYLKTD